MKRIQKQIVLMMGLIACAVGNVSAQNPPAIFLPGVLDRKLAGEVSRTFSGLVGDMNEKGEAIFAWKVEEGEATGARSPGIYAAYFNGTNWQQVQGATLEIIGTKIDGTDADSSLPWVSINDGRVDPQGTRDQEPIVIVAWQQGAMGSQAVRAAELENVNDSGALSWKPLSALDSISATFSSNSRLRLKVGP